ncbi:MAG TPA: LTA synthase family protein [Chthoniobacterales bacterium]|nr:LTA synthase family protein [Chthoniobacterales bacterium]
MTSPESDSTQPFQQFVADMVLWLALLLLFLTFRVTLFAVFRGELSQLPSLHAFVQCLNTGFGSDATAATWAILPSLALTTVGLFSPLGIWHRRVRQFTTAIVLLLCGIIFVADVGYFAEYDNQFDHWIFGLVYDDRAAIWETIWKSYHLVLLLVLTLAGATIATWLLNTFCRKAESGHSPRFLGTKTARAIAVALIVVWAFVGTRVWLGRNLAGLKNAESTGDVFLNKIVLNPFFALRYAIWQEHTMQRSAGLRTILPDGNIRGAAAAIFPNAQNPANLDDCLKRIAPGVSGAKPDHIFIVVMESYDAWAMQPEYAGLHLTDRLKQLGDSGIRAQGFVSSGISTIESLGVIITGLPFARAFVNFQPIVRHGLPTEAAPIFKQLGYKPRFFYGGYLSWQRIGEFCREQGFEEVYGGDQMVPHSRQKEWGVDDESLFQYVVDHTGDERTFNLIMTTSYHPPYSVNLETKGFDPNVMKSDPLGKKLSDEQIRVLGHLWYSDKCVGDFVSQMESKLQRPVFAVTGDHYSRKQYVSARPTHTLYESLAVPLVIYGPKALEHSSERPAAIAGSHLDIVPTFIDLVAPGGFEYHAFGRDLFDQSQLQAGYGCNAVIGPNFVLKINDPAHVEDLRGQPAAGVDGANLALHYRQLHALGWWRAMKGNQLPAR